jgi:hypothetical protein
MGIEVAALVIAAAATAGKAASEIKAANENENALDLKAQQMRLQTQQKTLQNYDVMEKITQAQIAHMTTTGTAFSSPSFNAIQRKTLNIAAKNQANIDITGELEEENIKIEKQNVKNSLYAQLFGDVSTVASAAYSYSAKSPSTRTT